MDITASVVSAINKTLPKFILTSTKLEEIGYGSKVLAGLIKEIENILSAWIEEMIARSVSVNEIEMAITDFSNTFWMSPWTNSAWDKSKNWIIRHIVLNDVLPNIEKKFNLK